MAKKNPVRNKLTEEQLKELADKTETALTELAQVNKINRFDAKKAEMFALSSDGFVRSLGKYGDVYIGLERVAIDHSILKDETALICQTCGWASPIDHNNDNADYKMRPSQHPEKRRVRLTVIATRSNQMVSSFVFADSPDEYVYDLGRAKGSLADALKNTFVKMLND